MLRACLNLTTLLRWWFHASRVADHEALVVVLHTQAILWRELLCFNNSKWGTLLRSQLTQLREDRSPGIDLWQRAALYWIIHVSRHRRYGGEALLLSRRAANHCSRILDTTGTTQQHFFQFIRLGRCAHQHLAPRLAGWIFLPIRRCTALKVMRLRCERAMILGCQLELNPPFVKALKSERDVHRKRQQADMALLQCNARPFKRRLLERDDGGKRVFSVSAQLPSVPSPCSLLDSARLAICAHRSNILEPEARDIISHLSPRSFALVYKRALSRETGWRRQRGVTFLNAVLRTRRDLVSPIRMLRWSLPWLGPSNTDFDTKNRIKLCIARMLSIVKDGGNYLPLDKRARLSLQWSTGPTFASLVQPSFAHRTDFDDCSTFKCTCDNLPANWPRVYTDWGPHVVCEQADAPWPASLCHYRTLPASTRFPPSSLEIAQAVDRNVRQFAHRARLSSASLDACSHEGASLSEFLCSVVSRSDARNRRVDIARIRKWASGLHIYPFDHALACLGFFCPTVILLGAQKSYYFGMFSMDDAPFQWDRKLSPELLVAWRTACKTKFGTFDSLPAALKPAALSSVARKDWDAPLCKLLPKFKCPGFKWRTIIDKHRFPRAGVHSCAARAISFLVGLASPCVLSAFERLDQLLKEFDEFNMFLVEMPGAECCWAGGDFVDCFTNLDLPDVVLYWHEFTLWLVEQGISSVSVAKRPRQGTPHIGLSTRPGWATFTLETLTSILLEFTCSNVVRFGSTVGAQVLGGPMGDPMSDAALRIWKWGRETSRPVAHTMFEKLGWSQENSRVHTALFKGARVVFLFVSFKDDCRSWAAWQPCSAFSKHDMEQYLFQRFCATYSHGRMKIKRVSDPVFVGVIAQFDGCRLRCRAAWGKPNEALIDAVYLHRNASRFQDWSSWAPVAQKRGLVLSLIHRCVYLSNSEIDIRESAFEVFLLLISAAHFPTKFLRTCVHSCCHSARLRHAGPAIRFAFDDAVNLMA